MFDIYLYTFLSVFTVSIISFVGIFTLSLKIEFIKKLSLFFVSLSAGTLLGGSFLHLLPEILEEQGLNEKIWLYILSGILVFFLLEKVILWRHCHIPTSDEHPHPLGIMNLVGDALHNFLDGIIIAGAFLVDPKLGFTVTLATIFHEIPQEIGDFGVLIHAGYSKAKALLLNFSIALTSMLGATLTLVIGSKTDSIANFVVPFTVGGFIYIATADLIPELKKEPGLKSSLTQFSIILIGILIMYLLKFL